MASNVALYTALSGLNSHARRLDVIGNNIANTNTTAFKSSRMIFQSIFTQDFDLGSAPSAERGGTNPSQLGLGVGLAAIQRDFRPGSLSITGDQRDLAIDGGGFFVVRRDGGNFYTRAGAFRQDLNDNLVTPGGDILQGFGVDDDFNLVQGPLEDINIPIGKMTIAKATTQTVLAGNLNAGGDLPKQGALIRLLGTPDGGLGLIPGATVPANPPNVLEPGSLISEIADPADPNTPMFAPGQSIELSGARKGDKQIRDATLVIDANTTVQQLMTFLNASLGIHATGPNPDGNVPGVALNPATGVISITGNTGKTSDLRIDAADIRLRNADGTQARLPFVTEKAATADGESVRTTMVVYDSLGNPLTVDVTMALETRGDGGTAWRYYIESKEGTGENLALGTGTIDFDPFGQLVDEQPINVVLPRDGTGAVTPLGFTISFTGDAGRTTALADRDSTLANVARDGLPPGTLENFTVGPDGIVYGGFSNGAVRTLGQVVLANFTNPGGLVDIGGSLFDAGPNSGPPGLTIAGTLGTGSVVGGALEMSNVDLGEEFINLIMTSTGYSASSRVIRTADELMQQLLVLGR